MATDSGTDKSASHGPGLALPLPTVTSFQKNTGLRTTGFAISASLTKRIFCWMLKLEAYCDQHPHDNLEMSLPLLELKQPTQRQQQVGPEASWSRPDGVRPERTSREDESGRNSGVTAVSDSGCGDWNNTSAGQAALSATRPSEDTRDTAGQAPAGPWLDGGHERGPTGARELRRAHLCQQEGGLRPGQLLSTRKMNGRRRRGAPRPELFLITPPLFHHGAAPPGSCSRPRSRLPFTQPSVLEPQDTRMYPPGP